MNTDVLARPLGIGDTEDWLEALGSVIEPAFWESGKPGKRAAIVSIRADRSVSKPLTGDSAEVVVDVETADGKRMPSQTIPLGEAWRLPAAGLVLRSMSAVSSAPVTVGVAESWDPRTGHLVNTVLLDHRPAAVALLDPEMFRRILPPSSSGETGRAFQYARIISGSEENAPRAIGASAAHEHLAEQAESHSDDGERPLWWHIATYGDDGVNVLSTPGSLVGDGPQRSSAIRTAMTDALAVDVSGRTRPELPGSIRNARRASLADPAINPDGPLVDAESVWQMKHIADQDPTDTTYERACHSCGLYFVVTQLPVESRCANCCTDPAKPDGQMSPKRILRPANGDGAQRISLSDPTGDEACLLASGQMPEGITRRELMDRGLTSLQANVLAARLNGFSQAEIAQGLKRARSTVATIERQAKQKLRRQ